MQPGPGPTHVRPSHVHGDRDVLDVLLARRAAGSVPGARDDGHRVALVVGGGGMRGSYVGGMIKAIEQAGLRPGFDEVYGSSSGAVNAAGFLVGGAADAAACYHDDMADPVFIDMKRLGRGPVVNLDFLMHEVLGNRKPMDWAALGDSATTLHIVATDTADLTAHALPTPSDADGWRTAVRASATIPLLAGKPVEYAGRRWIDGSVGEPLAVARALRGGATHVLVLLCRGSGDLHGVPGAPLSWWARSLDVAVPGLGSLAQGSRRYGADLQVVTDAAHPVRGMGKLAAIGPRASAEVGALCTDPVAVARAVTIGEESALEAIDAAAGDPDEPAAA
jgi:predicted patatin/cPLA2 family phospholipase